MATGNPRWRPRTMIIMTTTLDKGPNAPENPKFSVGMPSVRPIPPNADTSSNTRQRRIVSQDTHQVGESILLTDTENIEPGGVRIVHYLRSFDDAYEEDGRDEPPDIEPQLPPKMPAEVLADALASRLLLVEIGLLILIFCARFEYAETLLFVSMNPQLRYNLVDAKA